MVGPRTFLFTVCIVAAYADAETFIDFMGTELMGGSVTGPMINLAAIGAVLFLAGAVLVIVHQKAAANAAVAATPFCIPLYLYRIFPRLFVRTVGGQWADPPRELFRWHLWSVIGILAVGMVIYVAVGILRGPHTPLRAA